MPTRLDDAEVVDLFIGFVDRRRKQGYDDAAAIVEGTIDLVRVLELSTSSGGLITHILVALNRRYRVVLEERDRARQIAVDLEQELGHVDDLIGSAWFEVVECDQGSVAAWRELVARIRVPA
jgi:hypothetical protein